MPIAFQLLASLRQMRREFLRSPQAPSTLLENNYQTSRTNMRMTLGPRVPLLPLQMPQKFQDEAQPAQARLD